MAGQRGRPNKPTHLRVLDGGAGHRAPKDPGAGGARKSGVLYAAIPDKPDVVADDDVASAEWDRIAPILYEAGLITDVYMSSLAGYCASWSDWVDARQQRKATGALVVASPNNYPMLNTYLIAEKQALEKMRSFAADMGITPTSLARAERSPQGDLFDSLDSLLGGDDEDEDDGEDAGA